MEIKIVVGYCRTACFSESQINKQKKALENFAREYNMTIERFYVDNGVSGFSSRQPELEQLMHHCQTGHIRAVLISGPDRISRDHFFTDMALSKCNYLGIPVIITGQPS